MMSAEIAPPEPATPRPRKHYIDDDKHLRSMPIWDDNRRGAGGGALRFDELSSEEREVITHKSERVTVMRPPTGDGYRPGKWNAGGGH